MMALQGLRIHLCESFMSCHPPMFMRRRTGLDVMCLVSSWEQWNQSCLAGGHLPNSKAVQAALYHGYSTVCCFTVMMLSSIICTVFLYFFYCFCVSLRLDYIQCQGTLCVLYEVVWYTALQGHITVSPCYKLIVRSVLVTLAATMFRDLALLPRDGWKFWQTSRYENFSHWNQWELCLTWEFTLWKFFKTQLSL